MSREYSRMQWGPQATTTFIRIQSTGDHGVFHEAANAAKCCAIKEGCFALYRKQVSMEGFVDVMYRDPRRKMCSIWVKQMRHPVLYA